MSVDLHEFKFILELERLPRFEPPPENDPATRRIDFPAWRALFSSLLLYCHSTGYRLPSFDDFATLCERAYRHPRHRGRFDQFFEGSKTDLTRRRLAHFYESGMADTYLYASLVDVFEDVLQDGIVLFDPRADWKLKQDLVVIRRGGKYRINAFRGAAEDRAGIERWRAGIERERKRNTLRSSHWGNVERDAWTEVTVAVNERDAQVVNGVRLYTVAAINRCVAEICGSEGDEPYQFPESRDDRERLYRSLIMARNRPGDESVSAKRPYPCDPFSA